MKKKIKVEVLFPEICNYFGELYNIKLLEKTVDNIEVINTHLTDKPTFLKHKVDMIYIGAMTERSQELVIEKLKPYKEKIEELIKNDVVFLATGNALEVFGKYIEEENGNKIKGLGITKLYAKRDMMHRFNSLYLGEFENIKMVGFKSTFSMSYGDNNKNYFIKTLKGTGLNKELLNEGIRIHNFFGTYLLGPFLVLNPLFLKYVLNVLNISYKEIFYEEEIM